MILLKCLPEQAGQIVTQFGRQGTTRFRIRQSLKGALPAAYRKTQAQMRKMLPEGIPPFLYIPARLRSQPLLSIIGQWQAEVLPGTHQARRASVPQNDIGDALGLTRFFLILDEIPAGMLQFEPEWQGDIVFFPDFHRPSDQLWFGKIRRILADLSTRNRNNSARIFCTNIVLKMVENRRKRYN
ncbi:hypothetical protein CRQ34_21990 [Salmonella enterica subsp. enterica serovar Livingstone]|nr:hypothetical protein [Salmonella enterica subsp. enterica serovar Livingstone]